jgi:hypothetical protein
MGRQDCGSDGRVLSLNRIENGFVASARFQELCEPFSRAIVHTFFFFALVLVQTACRHDVFRDLLV